MTSAEQVVGLELIMCHNNKKKVEENVLCFHLAFARYVS